MKTEINVEIESGISYDCVEFQNTPGMKLIFRNLYNDNMPYWLWQKLQLQKRLDNVQFAKILNELFSNKWDICDEFVSVKV